jgi:phenylalanyl-tRNA synthetase alpha chain
MTDISTLETDLSVQIAAAPDAAALEAIRVAALGKSGSISGLLKSLGAMSPDERRVQGPAINGLRDRIAAAIAERKTALEAAELDVRLAGERLDLSLPAPGGGGGGGGGAPPPPRR